MRIVGFVILIVLIVACNAAPKPQWLLPSTYGYAYSPYSYYPSYVAPYYLNTYGYGYAAPYTYYI